MAGRSYLIPSLLVILIAGCGAPDAKFVRYEVFARKVAQDRQIQFTSQQRENIDEVLQALFGTPDEPRLPALTDVPVTDVLDLNKLKLAAGPVGSDEQGNVRGLYREHCAHCHGITGDGAGQPPDSSILIRATTARVGLSSSPRRLARGPPTTT
jgi:hypothetical protein